MRSGRLCALLCVASASSLLCYLLSVCARLQVLSFEDLAYLWVLGFTTVHFLYRCLVIGMLGMDRPMRRALERLWV